MNIKFTTYRRIVNLNTTKFLEFDVTNNRISRPLAHEQ